MEDSVGCSNCGKAYTEKDGRPYCESCQKYGEYKIMPPYDELLKKYEEALEHIADLEKDKQFYIELCSGRDCP